MTLQNGARIGTEAFLWADTAYFDAATGKTCAFDTKAFLGLQWPFAGTLSTIGGNPHDIATEIGSACPMKAGELLSATAKATRRWCKAGGAARVLLAMHDGGPRLFMVASDRWHPDVAPYEPAELQHYCSSGNRSAPYLLAQACGWTVERMLAQIDAQRAEPHDGTNGAVGHWIDGNAVELRVAALGVTSRVVREWAMRWGSGLRRWNCSPRG